MADTLAERVLRSVKMLPHGAIEIGVLRRRVDIDFVREAGGLLADQFREGAPTVILAPAVSGVTVATSTAMALGVPLILARKEAEVRGFVIHRTAYSSSEGTVFDLHIARGDIIAADRVLIVDDLMHHGQTAAALVDMVREVGAEVVGVGIVVEVAEMGRSKLRNQGMLDAKVKSLVKLQVRGSTFAVSNP